jgi:hypothetical protein
LAQDYEAVSDFSNLFWGVVIVLAVFVSCFFAWKAIERVRTWRRLDGVAVEAEHIKDPRFAGSLADIWHHDRRTGMSREVTDESLLMYGTRKQRKGAKERLKAREQAQDYSNGCD